ncbi:MAG: hypothetical protein ACR2QO_25585 [Acidimicrobiales bacterium]
MTKPAATPAGRGATAPGSADVAREDVEESFDLVGHGWPGRVDPGDTGSDDRLGPDASIGFIEPEIDESLGDKRQEKLIDRFTAASAR